MVLEVKVNIYSGRDHSEDSHMDGKLILEWLLGNMWTGRLDQERNKWWSLVNLVMNLRFP